MEGKRKVEIKTGHHVIDLKSGLTGLISSIQYVHNRYQIRDYSGWQYGIENLVIVP